MNKHPDYTVAPWDRDDGASRDVTSELRRRVRADQSQPRYEPCLPRPTKRPPVGPSWIHEIKHDGFRILAHCSGDREQLVTRAGNNFADRFPLIAAAIRALQRGLA
jgi:ATP-dependent DNA ligase